MDYQPLFEDIVAAVKSLKIVPDIIEDFIKIVEQCYYRLDSKDLEWIHSFHLEYYDNYCDYVKFISRVIAEHFLEEGDSQGNELSKVKALKANINAARKREGRLDGLLGETIGQDQVLEKVTKDFERLKQDSEAETVKSYQMDFDYLKDLVLKNVGSNPVFNKVIIRLSDAMFKEALLAVKSDYDHDKLKIAVKNIMESVPNMEICIENNRRALEALNEVLVDLEKEDEATLKESMRRMYPFKSMVKKACEEMMENIVLVFLKE